MCLSNQRKAHLGNLRRRLERAQAALEDSERLVQALRGGVAPRGALEVAILTDHRLHQQACRDGRTEAPTIRSAARAAGPL